ncbi:TonB-dependent receptor [Chitinophaga rhizosphaerae]|uniref:TonB-dependent receptor n=1 Tax=Chitinophaga rhizosphaerae TaxID=1864947 RepID=UPI00196BB2ED|nr:TonB-dependent receptor [Chitinophaga rhizosphaerae]
MRFSLSLLLFMILGLQLMVASPLKGQALDEKKITMEAPNITLEKALVQLERLSGFRVAFATEKVQRHQRVFMPMGTRSVSAALESLLQNTGMVYRYAENTILIVSQPRESPVPHAAPVAAADSVFPLRGKVMDETGLQLPGVSIRVKGTTRGVYSDGNGQFVLEVSRGEVILFSSVGSIQQEHIVSGSAPLSIVMVADHRKLEDVVIVGYGTQRKANLTGAVSTVDVKRTLEARPITDIGRGLQGAVPGLTITTASGDLGRNPNIRLRGMTGSLNGGGTQPLILVDGVEVTSLQMVNPQDIADMSVLKDAASAAIYGPRAAWGVILITTKSGKKGAPATINYSNNFSWSKPLNLPEVAKASDWAAMVLDVRRRTTNNPNLVSFATLGMTYDTQSIRKIREWEEKYSGVDLGDEMVNGRDYEVRGGAFYPIRTWDAAGKWMKKTSLQQKHDLSFSGGGDKTVYHLSLGYLNQTGILKVKNDRFDRYNATFNINTAVKDWMDVRGKMMFSQSNLTQPFSYSAATYGPWYYLYRWPLTYPYGTLGGQPMRSVIMEMQQSQMDRTRSNFNRVQIGTTIRPMEGLTIDVDYTYSTTNTRIHQVGGKLRGINFWNAGNLNYAEDFQGPAFDMVRDRSGYNALHTGRAFATYTKSLNKAHNFKVIAGMDVDQYTSGFNSSERRKLIDPDFGEISLALGDQFVGGDASHWATNGYFARVNYDYKNKYLLEVNGRYNGSSWFPVNDQWAFFPSASVGYVITEEKFMDDLKPVVSFLKLRGSWGQVGNQNLGGYRFLSVMNSANSGWLVGGNNMLTFSSPGLVSPTLTWEKVTTLDFGVDARFFDNKFGVTFDWYNRVTSDMITQTVGVPSTLGTSAPVLNFGELTTKGWELALDWNHRTESGVGINLTAAVTDFTESLTKFVSATRNIYGNYEGRVLGEIWGYETDRIFQEGDFTQAGGVWVPKEGIPDQTELTRGSGWFRYGPGDIKYKDITGDGKVTFGKETVDDHGDLRIIGNSTPRYQYSFRAGGDWKGIDLGVFFQGVGKRDYWASGPVVIPGFREAEAWYAHQLDYWTPSNPNAFYPRPTNHEQLESSKNFYRQTKYMLNMSYLRLKNLTLGYTLPQHLISRAKIKTARIYVAGENLVTFDKLDVPIDPEIDYLPEQSDRNSFGRVYPYRAEYSVGLQITF